MLRTWPTTGTVFFSLSVAFCAASSVQDGQTCGFYEKPPSLRIVGGREAGWREFPWQASVEKFKRHSCGGSIINEHWVLSAAHCFYGNSDLREFRISAGHHQLSLRNKHKQSRDVEKIIRHPDFGYGGHKNDLALVKVKPGFNFTQSQGHIGSVCLPVKDEAVLGNITISGWGKTSESAFSGAPELHSVQVPVMSDLSCQLRYFSLWSIILGSRVDSRSMFCAGFPEGGRDSCQGDSGGPGVQYQDDRAVIKGVVSWGEGCARPGRPGVYTEVPYFVPWIEETIKQHSTVAYADNSTPAPQDSQTVI